MKYVTLLCSFLFVLPPALAAERPNIVFVLTDDQTSSTLGCYGHPIVRTPNIDALAARGTRFRNAFVSQSICWVSRTTLLTSRTGRSYGTLDDPELTRADVAEVLVSDLLSKHGYRTGFFG
jgi:choline-sulfatase